MVDTEGRRTRRSLSSAPANVRRSNLKTFAREVDLQHQGYALSLTGKERDSALGYRIVRGGGEDERPAYMETQALCRETSNVLSPIVS